MADLEDLREEALCKLEKHNEASPEVISLSGRAEMFTPTCGLPEQNAKGDPYITVLAISNMAM